MDTQELRKKVNKIINDQNLPNEVKQKVEELYKNYEDVCSNCKYLLTTIMDKNNIEEIEEIQQYINDDIKGDIESIDTVNKQEYEIKKEKLLERINRELNKLEEKKEDAKTLQPILFDSEEEEKNYIEGKVNIEDRQTDRINIEAFITEVMNNMVAEMKSSRKYIKSKIDNIDIDKNDEQRIFLRNNTARRFEEDVEYVIMKVKKELPELGKVLEKQDNVVYRYIEDVINEYEKGNSGEKTSKEKCKDFRQSISEGVKVDEGKALQKVEEKSQEKQKPELNIELF